MTDDKRKNDRGANAAYIREPTIVTFSPYVLNEPNFQEHQERQAEQLLTIRIASSGKGFTRAKQLVENRFMGRGYSTTSLNLLQKPNRFMLTADIENITIGSVTTIIDSTHGLDADERFNEEIDHLRAKDRKLAEITNFAKLDRHNIKVVMAAMGHIAYIFARRIYHCTDFLIEVNNPRHSMFYQKRLGFKCYGSEKRSPSLNAPSILLCLDLEYMGKQIRELGGSSPPRPGEKSLYPYFFSQKDEDGITQRLLRGA